MVNRDRHDIVMEILQKANDSPKNKTELMTQVGLSYVQTRLYFERLIANGWLEIDEKNRFRTTKKGLAVMDQCKDCFLSHWPREKPQKRSV